nr:hypothetical protein [uncultured Clostridium sp.]
MDELKYYNSPISLEQAEQYIQSGLVTAARAYVANGYYLRRIRDDKLFEESGYQNFEDYVRGKYNKDKGWASKCIKVNQQLSEGGDSPILSKEYLEYSTYQLVELAYMTEEQREEVDPKMTVNQLKQIRKPEEVFEPEKSCDITTSEQEEEQNQEPEEPQDRTAYVKEQYRLQKSFLYPFAVWLIKNHKAWFMEDHMNRVIKVDKSEGQLKSYLGAYPDGSSSYGFPVDSETYYAKLYDNRIVISHFTDRGSVVDGTAEWFYLAASIQIQWNVVALEEVQEERRAKEDRGPGVFNSDPTSCPHRNDYSCTIPSENRTVPGDGYNCGYSCCWSCKFHGACELECNASAGRDGTIPEYDAAWFVKKWAEEVFPEELERVLKVCRERSTNAERAKAVQEEISPYGAHSRSCWEYDFSFHGFAGGMNFRIGKVELHLKYGRFVQELMNLYPDFKEPVSKETEVVIKEPESVPDQEENVPECYETVIDGEYEEVSPEQVTPEYSPRYFLEEQKDKLDNYLRIMTGKELFPADIKTIECQKTIVAALACMVAELEKPEPLKQDQPELPILKNNNQRVAFIDAYETWPIWIETKETGERYYRYDLSEKVAIVVKVYWKHSWESYKESKDYEYGAQQYYLMGVKSEWRKGKNVYVEDESRTFYECGTNRSALVEYLKDFQKSK